MADQEKEGEKPKDEEILEDARKALKECIDEEETEREKMKDDLRFCTLDQWPSDIRNERENDLENGPRPCLTIDKINQYIVQVVNDMRQGKPGINVRPQDDAADIKTAKILKGLVRNIEDQSNADIPYATAGESAAKIGLGYFRITTEYASPDSFDQEIFIRPIPNTFSVYLGKHLMPDGSDAKRGFIAESMPIDKFKAEFPGKKFDAAEFEGLKEKDYWHTGETVMVVEYFKIKRVRQKLLFLADGTTMSEEDYKKWPKEAGEKVAVQDERITYTEQLCWYKMTGVEVLEQRELPGKYIPIVEVIGRESWVDGKRIVWGLVRPAKDSLRMYNYWASTITEKMALAPKTPFIGSTGQFEGLEDKWKKANRTNFAYLEYKAEAVNGNALPAPQRQGATPMEAALLQQMQVIEHDVQTSLGMFKAAVGETESQQSGRAILALQRESDTGTYHFGANLGVSIRHAGRIIVDLIPHYYDTKRVVRILGEDGDVESVMIDPEQQEAHREVQDGQGLKSIYNPGVGKYDVSITVGPSYNTKRMEAAATFVELSKGADPAWAAVLHYLTVKNSDFAGAEEAAKMLRAMLPPPAAQALASKQPIPPEAMAMIQQLQQQMQQMQQAGGELQQENQQLKAGAQVQMQKVAVDAQAKQAQAQADHAAEMRRLEMQRAVEAEKASLARQIAAEDARLAREKAQAEFDLKKSIAEQEATLKNAVAIDEGGRAERKLSMEQQQRERDEEHKRKEQTKSDESKALPELSKMLTEAIDKLGDRLVAEMQKPKSVSVGAVQRDRNGTVTGATVRTTH